jgi:hypothetical protein
MSISRCVTSVHEAHGFLLQRQKSACYEESRSHLVCTLIVPLAAQMVLELHNRYTVQ